MIAFRNRFHGHGSLRYVYQKGAVIRGQQFALKYILNNRRTHYRLAVVVSKKVSKSAVKRNRIRRRIYEVVRKNDAQIKKSYDLVVTVYSDTVADMPHDDLQRLITDQLKRAGVIL